MDHVPYNYHLRLSSANLGNKQLEDRFVMKMRAKWNKAGERKKSWIEWEWKKLVKSTASDYFPFKRVRVEQGPRKVINLFGKGQDYKSNIREITIAMHAQHWIGDRLA